MRSGWKAAKDLCDFCCYLPVFFAVPVAFNEKKRRQTPGLCTFLHRPFHCDTPCAGGLNRHHCRAAGIADTANHYHTGFSTSDRIYKHGSGLESHELPAQ